MRLVKRPTFILALCGALGLAACGGGDDDDDGTTDDGTTDDGTTDDGSDDGATDDGGVNPDGDDHTYVISDVVAPASSGEATQYGLDIDGEAGVDNALGNLLGIIAGFGLNVQEVVRSQVDQGGVILLADLKATDLVNATGVGLYVYLGADANPAPCESPEDTVCRKHLAGDATFNIAEDSPQDAVVVGENVNGTFKGGPGEVTIQLALADGAEPLSIALIAAHAEATVSADGLTSGKLGGALTMDTVSNDLIPAVADIINGVVAADPTCTGTTAPCCDQGTALSVLNLLDADQNCEVSPEEIENNGAIRAFLAPDVDLLDESGNPGKDGTPDSISLGVGFEAVTGTFTPPAP